MSIENGDLKVAYYLLDKLEKYIFLQDWEGAEEVLIDSLEKNNLHAIIGCFRSSFRIRHNIPTYNSLLSDATTNLSKHWPEYSSTFKDLI